MIAALWAERRFSFVMPWVGEYRYGSRAVRSWIEEGLWVVSGAGRWTARARLGHSG